MTGVTLLRAGVAARPMLGGRTDLERPPMNDDALARIKAIAAVHYLHLGDPDRAMSRMSPDVVYHGRPEAPTTLSAWREREKRFHLAMSDIRTTIHRQIAEDDMVVTHWSLSAVHSGRLMTYPASGRPIVMKSMCIDRVVDDQVVEHWGVRDLLSVLRQIGVVETFTPSDLRPSP